MRFPKTFMLQEELGDNGQPKGGFSVVIDKQVIPTNDVPTEQIVPETEIKTEIKTDESTEIKTDIIPVNSTDNIVSIETPDGLVDFILDENGNATKDGKIVYTADQLDSDDNNDNTDNSLINIHESISQVSGLELLGEDGKPLVFKDGVEGLAEREIAVRDIYFAKGKDEALNSIFQNNPDLFEMYSYKSKHGSLDNFTKQTDYKTLVITEDMSSDNLKQIIKDYYVAVGNSEADADRFVRLSENEETLNQDALNSLNKLKQLQLDNDSKGAQLLREQELEAIKEAETYYGVGYDAKGNIIDKGIKGSLYDKIVKEGKINNIMIPSTGLIIERDGKKENISRNQIFEYFYKPIAESNGSYLSQAQIDEQKRMSETDNFLIQGIKNLTGGDLTSLEKVMRNVIRLKDSQKIVRTLKSSQQASSGKSIDEQLATGKAQIVIK